MSLSKGCIHHLAIWSTWSFPVGCRTIWTSCQLPGPTPVSWPAQCGLAKPVICLISLSPFHPFTHCYLTRFHHCNCAFTFLDLLRSKFYWPTRGTSFYNKAAKNHKNLTHKHSKKAKDIKRSAAVHILYIRIKQMINKKQNQDETNKMLSYVRNRRQLTMCWIMSCFCTWDAAAHHLDNNFNNASPFICDSQGKITEKLRANSVMDL